MSVKTPEHDASKKGDSDGAVRRIRLSACRFKDGKVLNYNSVVLESVSQSVLQNVVKYLKCIQIAKWFRLLSLDIN